MRGIRAGSGFPVYRFNPRPAVRPGDARCAIFMAMTQFGFNPRPAVRPGDAFQALVHGDAKTGFNPRPAVRPGDAPGRRYRSMFSIVSIRARP